jgi:hypothetical protein
MFKQKILLCSLLLLASLNAYELIFEDSFESYQDFSQQFDPWVLRDVDLFPTWGLHDYYFYSQQSPMAFIIFNPSMTSPPTEEDYFVPSDGDKYIVSFSATYPPNDDWLISPLMFIEDDTTVSLMAKSIVEEYGLERFNVFVSLGSTDPEDFTLISGDTYVEAPAQWTNFSYSLDNYSGEMARIAIQCVSDNSFMFMVDNFKVIAPNITSNSSDVSLANFEVLGNYPNPFNPETTIHFTTVKESVVKLQVYNMRGQLVKTLVNAKLKAGKHSIVWNGRNENKEKVSSGIYLYKVSSGEENRVNKMILMK